MSDTIAWMIEATVKAGKSDEFEVLAKEFVGVTDADKNALAYEYFLDGDTLHIYEKYTDSDAAVAHLAWFGENGAPRFMALADVSRVSVYGSPSADLKGILDGFGASYYGLMAGFAR